MAIPVMQLLGWEADQAQVTPVCVQLNIPGDNGLALGHLQGEGVGHTHNTSAQQLLLLLLGL